ncbi:hypothetical protein VQL36_16605 [Chengkuizengella sp. SCS-71B]|uniref:hypothetical protein n=1 Tax=Chengkuizengella sp. SCS-71B TaxID=3115290 RepID=UPI0032C247F8
MPQKFFVLSLGRTGVVVSHMDVAVFNRPNTFAGLGKKDLPKNMVSSGRGR